MNQPIDPRPFVGKAAVKISLSSTRWDRALANVSANCPVCKHARRRQKGALFWLVKTVEGRICPFCRAYERVFCRKSHEPVNLESTHESR
jgi:hypothetical protein